MVDIGPLGVLKTGLDRLDRALRQIGKIVIFRLTVLSKLCKLCVDHMISLTKFSSNTNQK